MGSDSPGGGDAAKRQKGGATGERSETERGVSERAALYDAHPSPPCGHLSPYRGEARSLEIKKRKEPSIDSSFLLAGICGNRTHPGSSSPPTTVLKTAGHTSTQLLPCEMQYSIHFRTVQAAKCRFFGKKPLLFIAVKLYRSPCRGGGYCFRCGCISPCQSCREWPGNTCGRCRAGRAARRE